MWSLSPVDFRNSPIQGRGVFARRAFAPGDVIAPYAPKQRRIPFDDPEATEAADTKLTLLSEKYFVIIPDTSVPGGWLANHSCDPNAAIYSDGEGRIQCTRPIGPGQEVTIFYGWVTENEPGRDPCLCGSPRCLGFINFDVTDDDAARFEGKGPESDALRARLLEYDAHLRSIGQEHVLGTVATTLLRMKGMTPP
jgi:SET domain-containing protein